MECKKEDIIKETKIFYSIINGGDGSAYMSMWESKELAIICDDFENEIGDGFAESTVSCITIKHEGVISINKTIHTLESKLHDLEHNYEVLEPKTSSYYSKYKKLYEKLKELSCTQLIIKNI